MERTNREWLVPLTGLAFIVLGAIGFVIGGSPKSADHSAREVVAWWKDNKDAQEAAAYFGIAAIAALVVFGGYLRRFLRTAAGEDEMLSLVAFAGITIVAVGFAIDATIGFALADRVDDISPTGVQALQALWDDDFAPIVVGVLLFNLGTGLSLVRTRALPRWIGWVMIAFAAIAFTPIGFISALGSALMVLVLSIMLSLRARAVPSRA
jgi:hypothetical protein